MEFIDTLLAVTVSMLAVFGLWCAIKLLFEMLFSPKCLVVAIELTKEKDAEMLDTVTFSLSISLTAAERVSEA